jgi:GTP-dependent phosphoenolpyruvate carboxykinase
MFNAIYIKIPMTFFLRLKKINPKVHMAAQRTQIAKEIWSKNSNTGGITVSSVKLCYRLTITKQHDDSTRTSI